MDAYACLDKLIELAEAVGIAIRRSPALAETDHPGGALVRLKNREILFLDPTASLTDQIDVAASALRGRKEIEDRFLPPDLRELIDRE